MTINLVGVLFSISVRNVDEHKSITEINQFLNAFFAESDQGVVGEASGFMTDEDPDGIQGSLTYASIEEASRSHASDISILQKAIREFCSYPDRMIDEAEERRGAVLH